MVVVPANFSPTAIDDSITAPKDGSITADVLANDSADSGGTISVTAVTQGIIGSVTFTANDVTYTPNAGFVCQYAFNYTISDGNG